VGVLWADPAKLQIDPEDEREQAQRREQENARRYRINPPKRGNKPATFCKHSGLPYMVAVRSGTGDLGLTLGPLGHRPKSRVDPHAVTEGTTNDF
jgi:hypothetical protein